MARTEIYEAALEAMFHDPDGVIADIVERQAYEVENEAKRLLLIPGSGHVYRRGGHVHQASAPGEPPASDTGHLLASIGHRMGVDENGVYGEVGSDQDKAKWLEEGTRHMAARPFLRPALDVIAEK